MRSLGGDRHGRRLHGLSLSELVQLSGADENLDEFHDALEELVVAERVAEHQADEAVKLLAWLHGDADGEAQVR